MRLQSTVPTAAVAIGLGLVTTSLFAVTNASAAGPGGWDRLGHGATTSAPALNSDVLALSTGLAGKLLVAGKFTNAGGVAAADRIATWNGTTWSAVGPASTFGNDIYAVATQNGDIYAGGSFVNAGGDADADHLAVWNGSTWEPFCVGTAPLAGNVKALAVIGNTLYVGGEFQNGGGVATADYLMQCDLTSGTPSSVVLAEPFTGVVYALAADSNGVLYAAGTFTNLQSNSATDFVAAYSGAGVWTNLDASGTLDGSVTGIVRSIATNGTDLYVGSDGVNIDGIAQADHIARWNGSAWSALGANAAGTNGFLPASVPVYGLLAAGSHVYATGSWFDVGGGPKADYIADFDGTAWKTMGSNGSGNGPLNAKGEALAIYGGYLHAGGSFTSAGGDSLAQFIARFPVPANSIIIPKVVINKNTGRAVMSIRVPGPGQLFVFGNGIKRVGRVATPGLELARPVSGPGTVKMKIKPNRTTMQKLRNNGSAKIKVKIKFKPTGGVANIKTKRIKLVLKPD